MARPTHFLTLRDVDAAELRALLDHALEVKAHPGDFRAALAGKTLGMVFEKSSTRTRISFDVGMQQLGGHALFLSARDIQLGRGESVADTARVLSRYLDAIMARVRSHDDLLELARHSTVPVVNGLSDLYHPCQALADYLTLRERFGALKELRVAYVGDGNNVAHSLMEGAVKLGVRLVVACPPGYEPRADVVAATRALAPATGAAVEVTHDPREAVAGAHAVYTDVWTSMGQEGEEAARRAALAPYRVDLPLFQLARDDAVFLHCLPAHRGEEVTNDVADHRRSVIFDQAENRLHAQKALLLKLMA